MPSEKIHTVIIAGNEAKNIERAVRSAIPLGSVTVIDGGSNDGTDEIAMRAGAEVIKNRWPGFAAQRRFAITSIVADWILFLDADEEISPKLAEAICASDLAADGYRIKRTSLFLGRWMKHGAWGRDYVMRLFRRSKASIEDRLVHEEVKVDGKIAVIEEPLLHYAQNDFETIGAKFTSYVPLMGREIAKRGKAPSMPTIIGRAIVSFVRDYILRTGFLDSWQGFVLAFWGAASVIAKYAEARRILHLESRS